MTDIFVYIVFGAIVMFDILLLVRQKKTITYFFRRWYQEFIFVPYAIGVIFLGHFINIIKVFEGNNIVTIAGLCGTGIPVLIVSIVMQKKSRILHPRWLVILILLAGYIVGDLVW